MTTDTPLRVALVGCGAVSRENLLPVLAGHDGIVLGPLVDRDERRARDLADAYGVKHTLTDADALTKDQVDAVILATPPAHHAPATIACAAKGLHVLVEKPMAIAAADAEAMVVAAERARITLSVGLYRRFLPSVQLLRAMIERQEFGRPVSVDAEEGGPYGWHLATLDVLRRASGGGGVLIDLGTHVLDVVLHVLNATPTLERYQDNERGGIETDCVLRASLACGTGSIPMRLELSRTRELRGSIRIQCEQATLELMRASFTEIRIHRASEPASQPPIQLQASWSGSGPFIGYEAFRREIDDWIQAIRRGTEPLLSGRSVVRVVRLIEDAYRDRAALVEPAAEQPVVVPTAARAPQPRRVLVTGAGGFLGGRAVEMLRDRFGYDAVALVREPKSAARLARWPREILLGDICSPADMARVMSGFDAVVHCAVGTSWKPDEVRRVTVDGTRIAAEAALAAGVKRFVHISTLFVHRRSGVDVIDETTPLEPPPGDGYGQTKLEAENALAGLAARGLSTIVLRPTRIYGPYSRTFTIRPLRALTDGHLVIGGPSDIPANMVYVDNVVAAIARAIEAPAALNGRAFLVTDSDQVTLGEFYEYFGRPSSARPRFWPDWRESNGNAGSTGLASRWLGGIKAIATSSELRGLVRRVLETDPIGTWPRRLWDRSPQFQQTMLRRFGADAAVVYRPAAGSDDALVYYGEAAKVSGRRAEDELGAVPLVTREEAMALTLEWARYARLLPDRRD